MKHQLHPVLMFLALLVGVRELCFCQLDSVSDCFPLSLGNQWTYRYYVELEENLRGTTDSGLASYRIIGKRPFADSVVWSIQEDRKLRRTNWQAGGPITYSTISDTTIFELVEENAGMHRLYRQSSDGSALWNSVFPLFRDMVDTAAINRYRKLDSTQTSSFEIIYPAINPSVRYTLTFRKDSGITQLIVHNILTMEGFERGNHELLGVTVTEMNDPSPADVPGQFVLFQNYPNPFNPSTTIKYEMPKPSDVRLSVFDILGREVSVLVNEKREAGVHEVRFDASKLASGVYFYRLHAGDFTLTKRLLLLK